MELNRGAGLVANSLLLSKLKSLTTVVREYLVSFRPGVAWSTLCLPRKFGGVGLVDIADQSLALHLVYLQRLLRPPSPSDFVSSWLVYAFQVYTGHKSILPWFCFPGLYQSRVSSVPALTHLGKLLLRLPKLVPSSGWSARWFLDLPLCSVLSTVPSVRPPRDPSSLDPRFLVSDVSFWQPDLGIVDGVTSHLAWSSRVLRPVFLALNRDRGPVSLVFPPVMDSKITVSNSSRSAAPVARLSLGALRRYWHPAKGTITSRMGPPLKLPAHLLLSPALWRTFWSLEMPAKAFTP
ncbi:Flap-structured DNA-binding and RNA-binding protein [Mucor velutinosus]|uniref:Flap-structured DNA-binding and RNA-binding protein n=1 Tax=Mucor velutinosus TaxID=708070 RepID=A0AAN7D6E3_9FUNG|nr:Flap-structured DNA-binding and RNA-binding protein [Mucor velutinosus]